MRSDVVVKADRRESHPHKCDVAHTMLRALKRVSQGRSTSSCDMRLMKRSRENLMRCTTSRCKRGRLFADKTTEFLYSFGAKAA